MKTNLIQLRKCVSIFKETMYMYCKLSLFSGNSHGCIVNSFMNCFAKVSFRLLSFVVRKVIHSGKNPFICGKQLRKLAICICKTKCTDQLRETYAADFASKVVQFLYFINPKLQASSNFLWLYSPVSIHLVGNHCAAT